MANVSDIRIDPITERPVPNTLHCTCVGNDRKYHSYSCQMLLWLTLNPPPRKVCPTCHGRGSVRPDAVSSSNVVGG